MNIRELLERHLESVKRNKTPYPIVCTDTFEFEGKVTRVGEISYKAYGTCMPKFFRRATIDDLMKNHDKS